MRRRAWLVMMCVFVVIGCGLVSAQEGQKFPKVAIDGSQVRSMHSAETGRDYDLYIHVPAEAAKDKSRKFPVVYILDGQWDFKLMDSVLGGLVYDKFVPPMVLVGITYSGADPDYNSLRAMDYTPVAHADPKGSGDAEKFYAFVEDKVIPFVESNYPGDPKQRVLMGSSFGGLFTLYAMFKDPALFSRYMAASPEVSYGDDFSFKQEAEYAKAHKALSVRLYMGVGSDEGLTKPVEKMMKVIDSRKYEGFVREFKVFVPERHASNKPELYNRGLRFLFAN